MIDAFSTVYRKSDNITVEDHNSRCLVLESIMEDVKRERKTILTPKEKLNLYTRTYCQKWVKDFQHTIVNNDGSVYKFT